MTRWLISIVLVAAVGCAGSVHTSRSAAQRDTWGDRLRAAIPPADAPDHAQLLSAFEVLAQALPVVAPGHDAELDRVRNACATLARSLGNLRARADFVKIGLVAAGDALDPDGKLALAAAALDPGKPLRAQYAQVRRALIAAAETMDRVPLALTAQR